MARPLALITGIRGQDGTLLAEHLVGQGWQVVGLARAGGRAMHDQTRAQVLSGCRVIECSLTAAGVIEEAISDLSPTAVFHLAAVHHSSDGSLEPEDELNARMTAVNFAACERLLRAIHRRSPDTRLVYAASSQIWTPRYVAELADEATARTPANHYALTKAWAMDCIAHYRDRLGVHAASAILFNHESPLRAASFVTRKISLAAARAALGGTAKLELRNVGAAADWSAARDIVAGLHSMAEALAPCDFILASGRGRSIRDVLDIAYSSVGRAWTDHVHAAADQAAPYLIGNTERAARYLGWRPQVEFERLIQEMVQADLNRLRAGATADLTPVEGQ